MDLKTSLTKLEQLRDFLDKPVTDADYQTSWNTAVELMGQVEELILRLDGAAGVTLQGPRGANNVYSCYVASALSAGSRAHIDQARAQIRKVIGKVRGMLEDPGTPQTPASVPQLLRTLRRFRECCQFVERPPHGERDVQDILWIMLRSQFDYVEREETLPTFGEKNYRPDFGIPELGTLIEVKFIGEKTHIGEIQDELLVDAQAYLKATTKYSGIAFLVYDAAHKLRDSVPFTNALKQLSGILDVIVVPGIGRGPT